MSDIREVWKYWPLKGGFRSILQTFYRAAILWWIDQKFKLLADISFESYLQNIAFSSLKLFLCAFCSVYLDDIQWNEVATSTAPNFNNSWPLYLNFSNMINLYPNIWFIKNSKCQQFLFLKGCYFVMGGPIVKNVGVFWETSVDFLNSEVLQLFPKYSQSYVNLNVKSRAKFNYL